MSKSDSTFSKSQLDLLKQFKKQITHPHTSKVAAQPETKHVLSSHEDDVNDADLFKTALTGVTKLDNSNIAKIERNDVRKSQMQKRSQNVLPLKVHLKLMMLNYQILKQCSTLLPVKLH